VVMLFRAHHSRTIHFCWFGGSFDPEKFLPYYDLSSLSLKWTHEGRLMVIRFSFFRSFLDFVDPMSRFRRILSFNRFPQLVLLVTRARRPLFVRSLIVDSLNLGSPATLFGPRDICTRYFLSFIESDSATIYLYPRGL